MGAVDEHVVVGSGHGEEKAEGGADPEAAGSDALVFGGREKRPGTSGQELAISVGDELGQAGNVLRQSGVLDE